MKVRITIHETDGLDESTHAIHVDVPTTTVPLYGARGVAVDGANLTRLTELLKDAAMTAGCTRPTITSITFNFGVA